MYREERIKLAVVETGPSILKGTFLSKFCGIVVLAFLTADVFRIYFWRMYLSMVVLGFLNGIVLFPILLSLLGTSHGKWLPCSIEKKDTRY